MQSTTIEEQLNAFFGRDPHAFEAEEQLIAEITQSLRAHKADVSNKDLIFALIQLLEIEKDVVKLDIYRNALEMVVQKTPDDV